MTNALATSRASEEPLLPVWPDAAGILGMSRSTAYRLASEGLFPVPVVKIGSQLRVRTVDLRRFLYGDDPPTP